MRLSDIMSGLQLSAYAEVALLLFLGAFVAIALSVFYSREAEEWERCRHLPLEGDEGASGVTSGALVTSTAMGSQEP